MPGDRLYQDHHYTACRCKRCRQDRNRNRPDQERPTPPAPKEILERRLLSPDRTLAWRRRIGPLVRLLAVGGVIAIPWMMVGVPGFQERVESGLLEMKDHVLALKDWLVNKYGG